MKRIFFSLVTFVAITTYSQEVVQSGIPALLEVSNGKKASVYLQKAENGKITFQARKSTSNTTAPADKIKSLTFSMGKEEFEAFRKNNLISSEQISEIFAKENISNAEKLNVIFNAILSNISDIYYNGDYAEFIAAIEPFMKDRSQYMGIKNNLEEYYSMMMESYRNLNNYTEVRKCAEILSSSSDARKVENAKSTLALVAISEKDFETAESLRGELSSEAGSLYIQAAIDRSQGNFKKAMQTVTLIIADHPNDQDWMPASELLAAYLYLDMTGTNSVISTNSAINTARQVKNIYAGSSVAGDARKLWASLGGEAIEALEKEKAAELAAAEKKAKEELAAKREEERLAKKAEQEAAKAAKEAEANLNTTTETQSESDNGGN